MNCLACQELLHHYLDREPVLDRAALDQHLAGCADCRSWHGAAQRLEKGLARRVPAPAPVDLTGRIVARVLADQRARLRLRRRVSLLVAGAAAVAASLLVLAALGYFRRPADGGLTPSPDPEIVENKPPKVEEPPAAPSLQDSVAEASEAVASLTRRAADEAVGPTRLLWPVVSAAPPLDDPAQLPPPFDPTARSLREAGQGITTGLEPVASSARRAFGLFLREIPAADPGDKSGSEE